MNKIIEAGEPKTLVQAHQALVRIRPSRDASLPAWFAYYQRSASVCERSPKSIQHTMGKHCIGRSGSEREQRTSPNE
jgi:hypothetical protein